METGKIEKKKKYSPRRTNQPEARSGALDLSFPPFNQRIADINVCTYTYKQTHTHTHTWENYDICKLVSQFRARKPDPPSLTEIDGRNFYAILLGVETIDTILLTTTTVCYQSSWWIYRCWWSLWKYNKNIEFSFPLCKRNGGIMKISSLFSRVSIFISRERITKISSFHNFVALRVRR